ncbi:DUF397 domain-containing protein [Streptomyces sp. KL118A]|uniref:DUF397 domain-containing protein n=1 Tax=Streptomyces sp. KL118A TaxID=3045153 RepID=UPI00278BD0F9|nr:DUF397 domain-containing protein [Streptomyces sp. KL118A]
MSTPDKWQKSSFSGSGDGNACVELASTDAYIRLRESDEPATELITVPETFAGLLRALRAGKPLGQQP